MTELSTDELELVIRNLDLRSQYSLYRACRRWRSVIDGWILDEARVMSAGYELNSRSTCERRGTFVAVKTLLRLLAVRSHGLSYGAIVELVLLKLEYPFDGTASDMCAYGKLIYQLALRPSTIINEEVMPMWLAATQEKSSFRLRIIAIPDQLEGDVASVERVMLREYHFLCDSVDKYVAAFPDMTHHDMAGTPDTKAIASELLDLNHRAPTGDRLSLVDVRRRISEKNVRVRDSILCALYAEMVREEGLTPIAIMEWPMFLSIEPCVEMLTEERYLSILTPQTMAEYQDAIWYLIERVISECYGTGSLSMPKPEWFRFGPMIIAGPRGDSLAVDLCSRLRSIRQAAPSIQGNMLSDGATLASLLVMALEDTYKPRQRSRLTGESIIAFIRVAVREGLIDPYDPTHGLLSQLVRSIATVLPDVRFVRGIMSSGLIVADRISIPELIRSWRWLGCLHIEGAGVWVKALYEFCSTSAGPRPTLLEMHRYVVMKGLLADARHKSGIEGAEYSLAGKIIGMAMAPQVDPRQLRSSTIIELRLELERWTEPEFILLLAERVDGYESRYPLMYRFARR